MALKDMWLPYKIAEVINVYKDGAWHCHVLVEGAEEFVVDGASLCYEYTKDLPYNMLTDGEPAHVFYGGKVVKPAEVHVDIEDKEK